MVLFKNPNNPPQPCIGVYEWYYERGVKRTSIYVGQAGEKESALESGTLMRGVHEATRATFSSNQGKSIDIDFIVGTALRYLEETRKVVCIWEHIHNDPKMERELCREKRPLLQDPAKCQIYPTLKCQRENQKAWATAKKNFASGTDVIARQREIIARGEGELVDKIKQLCQ